MLAAVMRRDDAKREALVVHHPVLENVQKRRASVFDVEVDLSGRQRRMADVGAAEAESAFGGQVGVPFDQLGDQFAENLLFGEVFAADAHRA